MFFDLRLLRVLMTGTNFILMAVKTAIQTSTMESNEFKMSIDIHQSGEWIISSTYLGTPILDKSTVNLMPGPVTASNTVISCPGIIPFVVDNKSTDSTIIFLQNFLYITKYQLQFIQIVNSTMKF